MTKQQKLYFVGLQLAFCSLLLAIWPRLEIDDSYIFLAYARNLANSGLFAFNPGEVSYGFSSPAYVIVLAAASRLIHIPVGVVLSNLLGVLMCGLSSWFAAEIWAEIGAQAKGWFEGFSLALLFSGPWFFTAWFVFGMETGLAATGILGYLLWWVKLRNGKTSAALVLLGAISAVVLVLTRLEASVYVGCISLLTVLRGPSLRRWREVAMVAGAALVSLVAWLLYAKHQFTTFMPWTATARLIFYLPGHFGLHSTADFYRLTLAGRIRLAVDALFRILFDGPLKVLLVALPLLLAVLISRIKGAGDPLQRLLGGVALCTAVQLLLFAVLFPLAANRHLAPYIVGIWVFVAPVLARWLNQFGLPLRAFGLLIFVGLWAAGALQFRNGGKADIPLHMAALHSHLTSADRVAAEPIGILAFDSPVRVIDIGGLTDRSAWPMLVQDHPVSTADMIRWSLSKGATKIMLSSVPCGPRALYYGHYCLVDADDVQGLKIAAEAVPR